MQVLFLADAMIPRPAKHNLTASNSIQYSSFAPLRAVLSTIPHAVLLGPTILATITKQAGFATELLECAFRPYQRPRLLELLREKPTVVCLSTTFILDEEVFLEHVKLVREHAPGAIILAGGPSIGESPEMQNAVDYYLVGEGEAAILPFVTAAVEGKMPRNSGARVASQPLASIATMQRPDWGLLKRAPDDFYLLTTQRGCKWRCTFCTYPVNDGYTLRYRDLDDVVGEIRYAYEKWGIFRYMFADSTFTHPTDRCISLLEKIRDLPFRVEWAAYARADTITPRLADLLSPSGCVGLFFGLESGNEQQLSRMKKGFTKAQAAKGVELTRGHGIFRTASWVVGFPGETKATIAETKDFIEQLGCEQNMINAFTLYGNAPAGLRPGLFGLTGSGMDWSHETMNGEEALAATDELNKELLRNDIGIGMVFDLLWLASVGLEPAGTHKLFRDSQNLTAIELGLRQASGEERATLLRTLSDRCDTLFARGLSHPIFSRAKTKFTEVGMRV